MSVYQRKSSTENSRWESAPKLARKKRYKDTQKASLKDFNIPPESGNTVHWIGQRSVASSEREQMTMKQRASAKQKESEKSAKLEPVDRHQRRILRTDLLYLQLTV